MNQTSLCLNSKFHQTFKIIQHQQKLSSSIHQWHILHTKSSTTCFQTSTTIINHENSFHKSSNHNFIINHFSQKHNIFIHMIFDIWIQFQQQLIIQFTCTNISSTNRHEFIHQISHKHLFSKSLNWIITYEKG